MRFRVVYVFIIFFLGFLQPWTAQPGLAENLKVGVLLPLSGKLSKMGGEIAHRSFQMALSEINNAGGIKGTKIELIVEDTAGERETGVAAMEKLTVKDEVLIVSGGISSTVAWLASVVAQEQEVPFLVSSASADRITESRSEYIFRINTPVSEQSRALETFLKNVAQIKSSVILYEESHFGQFWAKKIARQLKELGLKVVSKKSVDQVTFDSGPLLMDIQVMHPDLIYMVTQVREAAFLIQQFRELGINPKLFMGQKNSVSLPKFKKAAGDASEYVYSPVIWIPSLPYPGAGTYYRKFVAMYNQAPDYHGAQAYAAMYVVADALRRAESLTPREIRTALRQTNMMTVLGPVKFRSYGRKTQQNRLPTFLAQWVDGRLRPVWPKRSARVDYVYPTPKWEERPFGSYRSE